MSSSLAIHLGERFTLDETLQAAVYADTHGFDSIWVAEGRLTRDAVTVMGVLAQATERVRIGSGVVNNKSRNAALMATTFKTLDEYAPNRIILGIGAWWEPLASKVGTPLERPVTAMREYAEVLRRFFANEEVTFHGDFVHMDGVRFDRMYAENEPVDIPLYAGAVGPRMLQLAGEIMQGAYLDFLLPVRYLHETALPSIDKGIARRADGSTDFDLVQIVTTSVDDDDPEEARAACKAFLTLYLMQQPHIGEHCGVEPELIERVKAEAGWPARPEDVKRAMRLVPDDIVSLVTAGGTTAEAMDVLESFNDAGVRVTALNPVGRAKMKTIDSIARAWVS
jgi:Coenzyme F420-dependent N5,N10-methylene tetrahydromethanopterin reductase and related flavin-dependent oxidoreductases